MKAIELRKDNAPAVDLEEIQKIEARTLISQEHLKKFKATWPRAKHRQANSEDDRPHGVENSNAVPGIPSPHLSTQKERQALPSRVPPLGQIWLTSRSKDERDVCWVNGGSG